MKKGHFLNVLYLNNNHFINFKDILFDLARQGLSQLSNVGSMLVQRRRRWANIVPALGHGLYLLGSLGLTDQSWVDGDD